MKNLLLLLLLLLPGSAIADVKWTGAGQMGVAKTAYNEAYGDKSLRAVIQVILHRAELTGERVLDVLRCKNQFAGFWPPWKAEPEQMAEMVNLVADVWTSEDYGSFTNFWPVYKNDRHGRRILNPMPKWWTGPKTRIGNHWFGTMPFATTTKNGARRMMRMLAQESDLLAEFIFPGKGLQAGGTLLWGRLNDAVANRTTTTGIEDKWTD
jgi:hypothetical protein